MSRGINKVILVGNLGRDPEIRYTANGGQVTNITVATSEGWKDKQTGQMQERTEWHRVVFFDKLAEIAGQYLQKGSQVYIEGKLQTRKWQDQNGMDRYTTEIVVNGFSGVMQMLGSRTGGSVGYDDNMGAVNPGYANNMMDTAPTAQVSPQQSFQNTSAPIQNTAPASQQATTPDKNSSSPAFSSDLDDDIPF